MSTFLGITRERVFSPGRVGDDAAILEMVADCLRHSRQEVAVFGADDDQWPEPAAGTIVFAMCQGERALERLRHWQARGVRIVNRPEGILNCQRHRTVPMLAAAGVPFPESVLVETDAGVMPPTRIAGGAWIKRGDVHATEADDVVAINSVAAMRAALQRFRERGIRRAVVQRHVPGRVLKFYAVRERFFHCVQSAGAAALTTDVLRRIDDVGCRAARALDVEVYGGDCVCAADGTVTLIDLNDWPSYAPCRTAAATAIAAYLRAQEVATES